MNGKAKIDAAIDSYLQTLEASGAQWCRSGQIESQIESSVQVVLAARAVAKCAAFRVVVNRKTLLCDGHGFLMGPYRVHLFTPHLVIPGWWVEVEGTSRSGSLRVAVEGELLMLEERA